MKIARLKGITKSFASQVVLKNLSLSIGQGEFVSILGSSGSGKSTILRILAGIETSDSGERVLNPDLRFGFVFQEHSLLPWLNVEDNILLPFKLLRQKAEPIDEILDQVGLGPARKLFPQQLSGGMKMRASIARALVTRPQLLLMDEPFAALDEVTRFQLQDDLLSLKEQNQMSVVFVTHSISEAVYLSDRVLFLDNKVQQFTKEEFINLGLARTQEQKKSVAYNDYVSMFTKVFHS